MPTLPPLVSADGSALAVEVALSAAGESDALSSVIALNAPTERSRFGFTGVQHVLVAPGALVVVDVVPAETGVVVD